MTLREHREQAKLTLREVETATGISNGYLSLLESGKIRKPSAQVLYTLSKLYSTPFEQMCLETGMITDPNIKPAEKFKTIEDRMEELEKRVLSLERQSWIKLPN